MQKSTYAIGSIAQQPLAQLLPEATPAGTKVDLTDSANLTIVQAETLSSTPDAELTELIVFSELSIAQFSQLAKHCDINVLHLNAINCRNQLTSYRFNVHCHDITAVRAKLVDFNLKNNIDSAIIQQAPSLNQPGLLVMDMDSTAIKIECIDELAALAGVGEQVAAVTELAMQGKLDFSESLHQRVSKLANAPETILQQVLAELPLMEGLELLVKHLKQHHWKVAIASGGFSYFAQHLQDTLGLDASLANELEIKNQHLTGKVLGEVIDANAKAKFLTQLAIDSNIATEQTVAMGDGANDLIMMSAAGLGIAHHAKPIVLAKADSAIAHAGLDLMLHWLR